MRTVEEAGKWWPLFEKQTSLADLRATIKSQQQESITHGLRSACWKAFLLFEDFNRTKWAVKLQSSRDAYASLRPHFLRGIDNEDEMEVVFDPLSDNDDSPWNNLRKDEELRREIFQDVERCMPDNLYFRQPDTQNMLLDILFVWSKLNPDTAYRQGMHELLAPILWIVERDAIDLQASHGVTEDSLLCDLFCADYIANDTFTLFSLVMRHAKAFYEQHSSSVVSKRSSLIQSPMVIRSKRIVEIYLAKVDPPLAVHLQELDVVPQVFLMRWIRLLFGREFSFDDTLSLWDRIFSEDSTLECVDFICVAMLLRIRWQLIAADNSTALSLLLHYPEFPAERPAWTLVDDALYLRAHLNFQGGHHIITKHTQRPPPMDIRLTTPSTPRRPFSPFTSRARLPQSGGLEALLSDAAREVYTRGEKWGLNQAVRDAVGEVRKNVEGLQTRAQSRNHTSSSADGVHEILDDQLVQRIKALETRNKALARMLESAVNELWQQKESTEAKDPVTKDSQSFTMAVAKVQLVQVYLEDSSIPLPEDGSVPAPSTEEAPSEPGHGCPPEAQRIATDSSKGLTSISEISVDDEDEKSQTTNATASHEHSAQAPSTPPNPLARTPPSQRPLSPPRSSRPPLNQSSFSWILGQDKTSDFGSPRSEFLHSTSPFTPAPQSQHKSNARNSDMSYLFGDDDEVTVEPKSREKRASVSGKASKGKTKGKKEDSAEGEEEEVLRLRTLKGKPSSDMS